MIVQVMGNPANFDPAKNFPEFLKYGVIGLGAILAILAFYLLSAEQRKQSPRKAILRSIHFFMIFAIGLIVAGVLAPKITPVVNANVVPFEKKTIVDSLPKVPDGAYSIIKDISVFDLRSWLPIPEGKENEKISPVNYFNYLHVKKISNVDKIVAHYSTSGADIDLRCITHNYEAYQQKSLSHDGGKEYGIEIDISKQKVGDEFLVLVEATYWNGFKDVNHESASTYTDKDVSEMKELTLIVLLPENKGVTAMPVRQEGHGGKFMDYKGLDKFFVDSKSKRFIYWNIIDFKPDEHYKLDWNW